MSTKADGILGFTLPDGTVQATAAYAGFDNTQTWMASGKSANITYTNSTGKPIAVNIGGPTARGSALSVVVNGNAIAYFYEDSLGGNQDMMGVVIVPIGGTYQVSGSTPSYWYELTN